MKYFSSLCIISSLLMASTAHAAEEKKPYLEVVGMGGSGFVESNDFNLKLSDSETDHFSQTNNDDWDAWTAQVGAGVVIPYNSAPKTGDAIWFPFITPQINLYYLSTPEVAGDVFQFDDKNFDFLDYSMDFKSTRLMFDTNLGLVEYNWLTVYMIGGIGVAWNVFHIEATPNQAGLDCGVQEYHFDTERLVSFAYEFGAGVTVPVVGVFSVSLEYLYAGFNGIDLEHDDSAGFSIEGTDDLNLTNQSVMIGLRFAI